MCQQDSKPAMLHLHEPLEIQNCVPKKKQYKIVLSTAHAQIKHMPQLTYGTNYAIVKPKPLTVE